MLGIVVVEGAAIVLLGLLVTGLLRSHGEILRQLHHLGGGLEEGGPSPTPVPVALRGAPAPDLTGVTLTQEAVGLAMGTPDHDTVLAFLSSGCETCRAFWTTFQDPALSVPGGARLVLVVKDPAQESPARLAELAPPGATLVLSTDAWEGYRVPGAPYFVYVHGPSRRVIGEGTGGSWSQVASLLGQALSDLRATAGGDPVDAELAAVGIGPDHPSLYGPPERAPVQG